MRSRLSYASACVLVIIFTNLVSSLPRSVATPPSKKKSASSKATSPDLLGLDARILFGWFLRGNKMPKRDPFESEAEYQKRLPKKWNDDEPFYVVLYPGGTKSSHKYSYNAEAEELTIEADGTTYNENPAWYVGDDSNNVFAIQVQEYFSDSKHYIGKNVFGTKKQVDSYYSIDYILRITNGSDIPLSLKDGKTFSSKYDHSVTFYLRTKLPANEARKLANRTEVLLGIIPEGFGNTGFTESDSHSPTLTEPWQTKTYRCHLSARLCEVVLRNRSTHQIYARVPIPLPIDPYAPLADTTEFDEAIETALSTGDKEQIATAYANRGYARMTDATAGRRVKYKKAMEDFREALKNDPKNELAQENKALIEKIYGEFGLPIP